MHTLITRAPTFLLLSLAALCPAQSKPVSSQPSSPTTRPEPHSLAGVTVRVNKFINQYVRDHGAPVPEREFIPVRTDDGEHHGPEIASAIAEKQFFKEPVYVLIDVEDVTSDDGAVTVTGRYRWTSKPLDSYRSAEERQRIADAQERIASLRRQIAAIRDGGNRGLAAQLQRLARDGQLGTRDIESEIEEAQEELRSVDSSTRES